MQEELVSRALPKLICQAGAVLSPKVNPRILSIQPVSLLQDRSQLAHRQRNFQGE
jgi:hypothetical protein